MSNSFAAPWTVAHQASLSMGFLMQEHWSRLPFPSLGDLPYTGIKPRSPALQADSLLPEPPGKYLFLWNLLKEFVDIDPSKSQKLSLLLVFFYFHLLLEIH